MLKASYKKYILKFHSPAITSRATMLDKETYFVVATVGTTIVVGVTTGSGVVSVKLVVVSVV